MAREQNVNISIVDLIINLLFPHGAEEVSVPVLWNQDPWQLWEGGESRAGWRAGPELDGAGEPLQHGWGGKGLEPAWLGCRSLTVVLRDVLSKCAMAGKGSAR